MFYQNYNPTGSVVLSTLLAAVPILALLYFIALHPHRDAARQAAPGHRRALRRVLRRDRGVPGLVPRRSACRSSRPSRPSRSARSRGSSASSGSSLAAMFLYTMTVITGKFEIVKESIIHISFDRRLQVVADRVLVRRDHRRDVGLRDAGGDRRRGDGRASGFSPFQSAVLNLLANTAPVAWGAIGTPIVTLASVSGLDQLTLSAMAGRQLPFVSVLVPFWLVVTFVQMEGGTWKQAFEVWPCALCAGASFAIMQYFASGTNALHLITDVVSGVFSRASAPRCSCASSGTRRRASC